MIPKTVYCNECGMETEVDTYRKYVICSYCEHKFDFNGFRYRRINWNSSMYAGVTKWTECPVCRSENMYLGAEQIAWKCPDCGFIMHDLMLKVGVLWFCDDCETFMNIQEGFNVNSGRWECTVCGCENDVIKRLKRELATMQMT